jgi:hypothetical protein
LRVTRDFGQVPLRGAKKPTVRESDTVMRFLQSRAKVDTRYGGRFVQSIDGLEGNASGGRSDWFYFVNGIEAPRGAADRKLTPGDVIQWDYRRWDAAARVPAIVGAFPEPFLHGEEGKRFPTRVECAKRNDPACTEVSDRLVDAGIPAGIGVLGQQAHGNVLRVAVGAWSDLRELRSLGVVEQGPGASGVFARFSSDGAQLELLDAEGKVARTLGPGSGLVAAVKPADQQPIWIIAGTDAHGVDLAARLLERGALRNAYAVAVTSDGPVKLPAR